VGDKCHVEGMKYILLALAYLRGITIIIHVARFREQKGVELYGKIGFLPYLLKEDCRELLLWSGFQTRERLAVVEWFPNL
jgi:hypothetical protein